MGNRFSKMGVCFLNWEFVFFHWEFFYENGKKIFKREFLF